MTLAAAVEGASLRLGDFALRDLDLALGRGEILVLLGPNGAGKSVSLEMIAGFHRPQRGRILVAGDDVTRLPPERRGIGLVVQDFGLFPHLTVAANVAFGRPGVDIAALLKQVGIGHLAARRPGNLSAGERQRTALARALAIRPLLFLFDEPFSALDARTRTGLRDELKSFLRD
ncbi:MAG TPA: ATP-binding cassette domain-containing protein, partial [Stellaceae bacterium]|nr:ATP-binding cassette domain-containing protein [Stellaceae bacterium]